MIELVGLTDVACRRVGGFSLGMGQRLGIASALLGDPRTVILDEPANGLDPEGILWIRTPLKDFAAGGRTVFVSSHVMSEMALPAQRLVIVGQGRLITDTTVDEVVGEASTGSAVRVRTPHAGALQARSRAAGGALGPVANPTDGTRDCGQAKVAVDRDDDAYEVIGRSRAAIGLYGLPAVISASPRAAVEAQSDRSQAHPDR